MDDKDFYFNQPRQWTAKVPQNNLDEFINTTLRSEFSLCPRGYGKQSFRFYEVMQLNSIPVFIYNGDWFPFDKYINWDDFSVVIHENEIESLKEKLLSYTQEDKNKMLKKGKEIYKEYFTMEGMSKTILRHLQDL